MMRLSMNLTCMLLLCAGCMGPTVPEKTASADQTYRMAWSALPGQVGVDFTWYLEGAGPDLNGEGCYIAIGDEEVEPLLSLIRSGAASGQQEFEKDDAHILLLQSADGRVAGINGGTTAFDIDGMLYNLSREDIDEIIFLALKIFWDHGCDSAQYELDRIAWRREN